jgi:hypothetical protein
VTLRGAAETWGGACNAFRGADACLLVLDAPTEAWGTVYGGPPRVVLNRLDVTIAGPGVVKDGQNRIRCGRANNAGFTLCMTKAVGRAIDLRAIPGRRARFAGWTGGCQGTQPICRIRFDKSTKTATATALFRSRR